MNLKKQEISTIAYLIVKSSKNTIIPKQEASNNDKQVAWMLPCCI